MKRAVDVMEAVLTRLPAEMRATLGPNILALIHSLCVELADTYQSTPVSEVQAERISRALVNLGGELRDIDQRLRRVEAAQHMGAPKAYRVGDRVRLSDGTEGYISSEATTHPLMPWTEFVGRSSYPVVAGCPSCSTGDKEDELGVAWFGPCDRHLAEYLTGKRKVTITGPKEEP